MEARIKTEGLDLHVVKENMKNEFEEYYGTPQGFRALLISGNPEIIGAGFFETSSEFGWVSSQKNLVEISTHTGEIHLCGRRHGLWEIFRFFPENWVTLVTNYSYQSTQREDIAPWETTT